MWAAGDVVCYEPGIVIDLAGFRHQHVLAAVCGQVSVTSQNKLALLGFIGLQYV